MTDFQRDRVPITDNVDSAGVEPFLAKTDAACQTCGNTKGAPASRSSKGAEVPWGGRMTIRGMKNCEPIDLFQ
jgi:hypothetical protein